MKKYFSIAFLFLCLSIVVFAIVSFRLEPVYNLDISENNIVKNTQNSFSFSASTPKNVWYIGVDKAKIDKKFVHTGAFCVEFYLKDKKYRECLDTEQNDTTDKYYTFPIVTPLVKDIAFKILYNHEAISDFEVVKLYSQNTLPIGKKLALKTQQVEADSQIISRAWWGADETIRYKSHPKQAWMIAKNLIESVKPKTPNQIKAEKKLSDINAFVGERLAKEFTTTEIIRTENGQELVWPIQKVDKVNKIVIHHTADNLDGRSDEELLRAIYSYHAITRGWGDIWYNYIVGQNGAIYEGRAGGNYVVGAHAAYNNIGSVGISVLGDYEKWRLNSFQKNGLKSAIDMVVNRYGINVNANIMGFRPCRSTDCYPIQTVYTKALLGHRDVGITNCPGKNIYNSLPIFRKEFAKNIDPVFNPNRGNVESRVTNISTVQDTSTSIQNHQNLSSQLTPFSEISAKKGDFSRKLTPLMQSEGTRNYFWEKFWVKLSYPENLNQITLSAFWNVPSVWIFDSIRIGISAGKNIEISPIKKNLLRVNIDGVIREVKNFSLSSGIIEINSWMRIPDWDKQMQYNDNLFRDTIEIFNDNWKLIVVNHLPLEYYLKGLGEVSNNDLPEKIKTITVAARWYANYYMQKQNRKYNTDRYDGSDNPDSFQNYIGFSYEMRSPNVATMVDATKGEIIYFQNQIIKPWYFSQSDGRTLSFLEYCQKNSWKNCEEIPYLPSTVDPAWNGWIRSGHGVGISGIGATDFAKKGWNYKQIIQYYLPGTEIRK